VHPKWHPQRRWLKFEDAAALPPLCRCHPLHAVPLVPVCLLGAPPTPTGGTHFESGDAASCQPHTPCNPMRSHAAPYQPQPQPQPRGGCPGPNPNPNPNHIMRPRSGRGRSSGVSAGTPGARRLLVLVGATASALSTEPPHRRPRGSPGEQGVRPAPCAPNTGLRVKVTPATKHHHAS
jgi:hypothetical protein